VDPVNREQLLPELDQAALPHGGKKLLRRDGRRKFWIPQVFTPGSDSPGRNDNNAMPGGMLPGALAHQFHNMGAVQAARTAC